MMMMANQKAMAGWAGIDGQKAYARFLSDRPNPAIAFWPSIPHPFQKPREKRLLHARAEPLLIERPFLIVPKLTGRQASTPLS
jgi:hypothetical protein